MLSKVLGIAIMCLTAIYVWHKLYNEKINVKSMNLYFGFSLMLLLICLSNFYLMMYLKILTVVSSLVLVNWIIFRNRIKVAVISTVVYEILTFIAETVFSLIVIGILSKENFEIIVNNYFGSFLTNLVVSILIVVLIQFKIFKKIYNLMLKYTDKISVHQFLLIVAIFVISYNLLFFLIYSGSNFFLSIIICTVTTVVYAFIMFKIVQTQNNYFNLFLKYNNSLDSLKEYEKMIDLYRMSNHENKNQLLTIRNMSKQKDSNISNYIDMIVDNKIKDDEKLMRKTAIIPAGGLRAVIYSKLLDMKGKNIKSKFSVDKKIKTVQLIELGDDLMIDICKIVSIFLDNAIDAVSDAKQAMININLYISNNKLCIIISNNFIGTLDIDKIDNRKYTTKGIGRGYGLSLVKHMVDKNDRLCNIRKVNDDVFMQELQIKM